MKYIIIGGVAGGATAAARIRRNTEKAEIILFEKGEYISYANCGLPYYIGGVIEDRERLFVQTPESFGKRFNIDIRTRSEVTAIDVKKKEVTVRSSGKTYTESYDKLLLSPGASPVRPPLPGIDTEGIFTLRNVNDTDRIKSYMQQKSDSLPKTNREPQNDGLPPQQHEAERRQLLFFGVPDVQTGCADSHRLLPI